MKNLITRIVLTLSIIPALSAAILAQAQWPAPPMEFNPSQRLLKYHGPPDWIGTRGVWEDRSGLTGPFGGQTNNPSLIEEFHTPDVLFQKWSNTPTQLNVNWHAQDLFGINVAEQEVEINWQNVFLNPEILSEGHRKSGRDYEFNSLTKLNSATPFVQEEKIKLWGFSILPWNDLGAQRSKIITRKLHETNGIRERESSYREFHGSQVVKDFIAIRSVPVSNDPSHSEISYEFDDFTTSNLVSVRAVYIENLFGRTFELTVSGMGQLDNSILYKRHMVFDNWDKPWEPPTSHIEETISTPLGVHPANLQHPAAASINATLAAIDLLRKDYPDSWWQSESKPEIRSTFGHGDRMPKDLEGILLMGTGTADAPGDGQGDGGNDR